VEPLRVVDEEEKKNLRRHLLVSWEANIRARGRHVISKQQEGAFYILRSGGPTPPRNSNPQPEPHPKPTPTNPHPKSPRQRTISHPLDGPKHARTSTIFSSKKQRRRAS